MGGESTGFDTQIAGDLSELGRPVSGEVLIRRETFTPWDGFDETTEEWLPPTGNRSPAISPLGTY